MLWITCEDLVPTSDGTGQCLWVLKKITFPLSHHGFSTEMWVVLILLITMPYFEKYTRDERDLDSIRSDLYSLWNLRCCVLTKIKSSLLLNTAKGQGGAMQTFRWPGLVAKVASCCLASVMPSALAARQCLCALTI